eukprot:168622_1
MIRHSLSFRGLRHLFQSKSIAKMSSVSTPFSVSVPAVVRPHIGGEFLDASSGNVFSSINPATTGKLCDVQSASEDDVNKAVMQAQTAFTEWSQKSGAERGRVLRRIAELLRENNDALAEIESRDQGKCISESSTVDITSAADAMEYFGCLAAEGPEGAYIPCQDGSFAYTIREPLGVVAGIGAWNYPIQIACWKSAPALACGNTMIFKPSPETPVTTSILAEIMIAAGLPKGVFNVVNGGADVGTWLSTHPGISKISFTGSSVTGRKVYAASAGTLKYVTMELGGKSPLIIFPDSNLDNAVSAAMLANFYTQGEICTNGTRVFIHEDIAEEFTDKFVKRTKNLKIGDPLDPQMEVGALISEAHLNKVMGYIESAKEDGARLRCGGKRYIPSGNCAKGYFVEPTIFDRCSDEMKFVKDEIFGPVAAVLSFKTEEEVVHRANNTPYGLAGGVFTSDIKRAHRIARQLQCGAVWINNYNIAPVEVPFGGYKQSGVGRENGKAVLDHYTQTKSVFVEMNDVICPYK